MSQLIKNLTKSYLQRLNGLVDEGEQLLDAMNARGKSNAMYRTTDGESIGGTPDDYSATILPRYTSWRTTFDTVMSQLIPASHRHWVSIGQWDNLKTNQGRLERAVPFLKALLANLESDFVVPLVLQIEAQVASDYMGQAKSLLNEGKSRNFDHVPAAVLVGAVLEKGLRTLCDKQTPPIPTTRQNGDPKTMNPLIDDLRKASLFNEAKAKQLRAWADIRNHAAHGRFDEFNRQDVEPMIDGVTHFLADYLG